MVQEAARQRKLRKGEKHLSRPWIRELKVEACRGWRDGVCTSPPRPRGGERSPSRAPGQLLSTPSTPGAPTVCPACAGA